jgi:two-component system CheB/CheR fusion protein
LRQIVEHVGARAIVAEDGHDALTRLADTVPDLIFSDLVMPRVNGFAFVAEVRRILDKRRPPVVAVSVLGETPDVYRTWAAGFDGHLVKPINVEQVKDWVTRLAACGRASASDGRRAPARP